MNHAKHFKAWLANYGHLDWFRLTPYYRDVYPIWSPKAWKARGWLVELWYYIKCAVWHRYNVVRIKTLPPTWNEWDERLLHGMMAILTDFIENAGEHHWTVQSLEEALREPDPDGHSHDWCRNYLPVAREMEDLYVWWTVRRPARLKMEEEALSVWHEAFTAAGGLKSEPIKETGLRRLIFPDSAEADKLFKIHNELDEAGDREDEENLIRLVKIRQHLWT